MKPAPFDYERPATLNAALTLLKNDSGTSKIIAGGQSLVPMMNFRIVRPDRLIDINRISELDYHRIEGSDLVIGALCRHAALKESEVVKQACPMMHAAYEWVAHGPVRNRGTLCGNLCHADPASEMPAVVLATDAVMVLRSSETKRSVPVGQFFVGQYETATADNEILVEVRIPVARKSQGWGFHEVNVRKGDFAIVAAAATLQVAAAKGSGGFDRPRGRGIPCDPPAGSPRKRLSAETRTMQHSARRPRPVQPQSILTRIFMAPRNTAETSPRLSFTGRCVTRAIGAARLTSRFTLWQGEAVVKQTEVTLRVNKKERRATVAPRLLLSDFLRHNLHLHGTHVGCEHGVCGACTVIVDGSAVRSCLMFAVQADGCEVTTVEVARIDQ